MFGVNVTDYDKKVWEEELRDLLPDKIVDAHVHIWLEGMEREDEQVMAWTWRS